MGHRRESSSVLNRSLVFGDLKRLKINKVYAGNTDCPRAQRLRLRAFQQRLSSNGNVEITHASGSLDQ
jgi:hypothetical protein